MIQNDTVATAETESAADYKPQVRTGGLFCCTYHIEMQKILKRWDTLLLLLGATIPLALSISLAAHASSLKISATTKIDVAQFLVIITQVVASVCIFHLIAALYAARFYCSEVENNSILLYVPRICNRGIQYFAKFLALLTAVTVAQIITGLASMLCFYFILVPSPPDIATAQSISGNHGSALAAMLLAYLKIVDSGNPQLDAVLNLKLSEAQQAGIQVQAKVFAASGLRLTFSDLCVLLGNAFDNAIEACEMIQPQEKIISLEMSSVHQALFISISNPLFSPVADDFPSTKRDVENHGFGLKSIQYIAEKYNGTVNIRTQQQKFDLEIVLQNPN